VRKSAHGRLCSSPSVNIKQRSRDAIATHSQEGLLRIVPS
jgi:hypothetical protein